MVSYSVLGSIAGIVTQESKRFISKHEYTTLLSCKKLKNLDTTNTELINSDNKKYS